MPSEEQLMMLLLKMNVTMNLNAFYTLHSNTMCFMDPLPLHTSQYMFFFSQLSVNEGESVMLTDNKDAYEWKVRLCLSFQNYKMLIRYTHMLSIIYFLFEKHC